MAGVPRVLSRDTLASSPARSMGGAARSWWSLPGTSSARPSRLREVSILSPAAKALQRPFSPTRRTRQGFRTLEFGLATAALVAPIGLSMLAGGFAWPVALAAGVGLSSTILLATSKSPIILKTKATLTRLFSSRLRNGICLGAVVAAGFLSGGFALPITGAAGLAFLALTIRPLKTVPTLEVRNKGGRSRTGHEMTITGEGGKVFIFDESKDRIKQGGMAEIFTATRMIDGREDGDVVIKVLMTPFVADTQNMTRFKAESTVLARVHQEAAKATGALHHPNLVVPFDCGEVTVGRATRPWIAMEYLKGKTIQEYMTEHGTFSLPEACNIILQVLNILKHFHSLGLFHRDIDASNVMLVKDEDRGLRVVLIDAGITKDIQDSRTGGGVNIGKPGSQPYEQSADWDARSDLWQVGNLLNYLLTGHNLYPFNNASEYSRWIGTPTEPDLDAALPPNAQKLIAGACALFQNGAVKKSEIQKNQLATVKHLFAVTQSLSGLVLVEANGFLVFLPAVTLADIDACVAEESVKAILRRGQSPPLRRYAEVDAMGKHIQLARDGQDIPDLPFPACSSPAQRIDAFITGRWAPTIAEAISLQAQIATFTGTELDANDLLLATQMAFNLIQEQSRKKT